MTLAPVMRRFRRRAEKVKRATFRALVLLLVRVVRVFLKPKMNRAERRAHRHAR